MCTVTDELIIFDFEIVILLVLTVPVIQLHVTLTEYNLFFFLYPDHIIPLHVFCCFPCLAAEHISEVPPCAEFDV